MVKPKDFKMQIIFFTFMRSCKLYYRPLQDKRKFKNLQQEMVGFNHRDNRCRKLSLTMSNSMLTSIGMSISISIGMYSHLIVAIFKVNSFYATVRLRKYICVRLCA